MSSRSVSPPAAQDLDLSPLLILTEEFDRLGDLQQAERAQHLYTALLR
ncbi:hypothetical protein [Streptomyces sp. Ag109_O5-1]|nr:hypothetical protein [Streptomyces sp. Ag109_O5-1]